MSFTMANRLIFLPDVFVARLPEHFSLGQGWAGPLIFPESPRTMGSELKDQLKRRKFAEKYLERLILMNEGNKDLRPYQSISRDLIPYNGLGRARR